ncbi:MAG: Cys-Gln thioester bond-forming surface protein [Clostridia bacterium]|nr:Cys-Gln thioester bond-forming surface protein [Clostridia bacterium]
MTFKRTLFLLLTLLLCAFAMGTAVFAAETLENGNIWYGDEIAVDVKAGTNGYVFRSVYGGDGTNYANYETSNHILNMPGGAVSLLPMLYAYEDYTWIPNGLYEFGSSNYEVMYCCDYVTGYEDGVYYKRINLEDSDYYDADAAAHIRAIVTNSYPYISLEQMKKNLAADGFEYAEELDRAEIIAAVQSAIWHFANEKTVGYGQTADINTKAKSWGGVMHDYSAEMSAEIQKLNSKYAKFEDVGTRVDALIEYLKGLKGTYAEKHAIVISELSIVETVPVQNHDGTYQVVLRLVLNNSGSSQKDDLQLAVSVDGAVVQTRDVKLGVEVYDLFVQAKNGQTIEAVVSGTQTLPLGVYFYEPDGGRDVSQCLVGVASGETSVYASASVSLDLPEEAPAAVDLLLKKVDNTGAPLSGAKFDLSVVTDGSILHVDTYKVDKNGQLQISDLLPGRYILEEKRSPSGYLPLDAPIVFEVEDGETAVLRVVNAPDDVRCELADHQYILTVVNCPIPTEITFSGVKYLGEEFGEGFEIAVADADTFDILGSTLTDANGEFSFTFDYTKEGTYRYIIFEVRGEDPTVIYDRTEYMVTVTVDAEKHGLAASADVETDKLTFHNTRILPTTAQIFGTKYFDGALTGGYTFALADQNGDVLAEAVSDENGVFAFAPIEYTEAGTYFYTVYEVKGDDDAIIYDTNAYDVTVTVTLNGDTLEAEVFSADEIVFRNRTRLPAEAVIAGTKYLDDKAASGFTFLLMNDDGMILSSAESSVDGSFRFPVMTYMKAGEYHYTVREVQDGDGSLIYDKRVVDVTVTVVETENGFSAAVTAEEEIVFRNVTAEKTPASVQFSGIKYLDNEVAGGFIFLLTDENGVLLQSTESTADGIFAFETLTFDAVGTYVYHISEYNDGRQDVLYDENEYMVTVTVVENGSVLTALVEKDDIVFNNLVLEDLMDDPTPLAPSAPTSVIPQTGDDIKTAVIAGVVCVMSAACAMYLLGKKRRTVR